MDQSGVIQADSNLVRSTAYKRNPSFHLSFDNMNKNMKFFDTGHLASEPLIADLIVIIFDTLEKPVLCKTKIEKSKTKISYNLGGNYCPEKNFGFPELRS